MRRMLVSPEVKGVFAIVSGCVLLCFGRAAADDRVWDQEKARKMVGTVMKVEATKKRPWNNIPWRTDAAKAAAEAKKTGKPLFVYFYVAHGGPPLEPC